LRWLGVELGRRSARSKPRPWARHCGTEPTPCCWWLRKVLLLRVQRRVLRRLWVWMRRERRWRWGARAVLHHLPRMPTSRHQDAWPRARSSAATAA